MQQPLKPPRSIAFVAAGSASAKRAMKRLQARYPHVAPEEAAVIVALGGDGFMLHTLHQYIDRGVPIYGMNRGTVGFLLNEYHEDNLPQRLAKAVPVSLHPLRMEAVTASGEKRQALAINEVALLRQTRQAAYLRISVDGVVRMRKLCADGVLVATPAGSTAYNLSVHGPIIPVGADLLALTPISNYRPRNWRGALLPHSAHVTIEVLNPRKRPVSATADHTEVRDVARVEVAEASSVSLTLLFDPEHNFEERILKEQFTQ